MRMRIKRRILLKTNLIVNIVNILVESYVKFIAE
jgi:hypothetical protein